MAARPTRRILMSDETQAIDRVREQARKQMQVRTALDYGAPAELFACRSKNRRGQFKYMRFDTAAEAIRFAVENVPAPALLGAYLEVDEVRFGRHEIHDLYENAAYPLKRCGAEVISGGTDKLI
jgi:hypothetical protein